MTPRPPNVLPSFGTWRLLCSPLLITTCFRVRGYNILFKKELHRSLQAVFQVYERAVEWPLAAAQLCYKSELKSSLSRHLHFEMKALIMRLLSRDPFGQSSMWTLLDRGIFIYIYMHAHR